MTILQGLIIFTAMAAKYELHKIVYFHRKQARLSRTALADLAGVGKTAVYDIEKGKNTMRWVTIIAILDALNIDIEFNSPLMEIYAKGTRKNA